ncbi:12984_t:CDS:2, partial [Acaulospora colombiana]
TNWRVIKTEKVVDVRDLIPEPQRTQVRNLVPGPKPLKGCWVDVLSIPIFKDMAPSSTYQARSTTEKPLGFETGVPSFFPVTDPGQKPWYYVGSTFHSPTGTTRILIVQENEPGALCPVQETRADCYSHTSS